MSHSSTLCNEVKVTLCVLTAAVLTACGGGTDASSAAPVPSSPTLTLTGTAAVGQALVNRPVSVRCAVGSGSSTTGTDGRFSISITGGALPCLLQATSSDGSTLHSAAGGSGPNANSLTVTANITPITELVVAQALGASPASAFGNLDNTAQLRLTTTLLQSAVNAVAAALQGAVDLGNNNPLQDVLLAATANTAGNGLDQQLDALQRALTAAQTTLAQLTSVLLANTSSPGSLQDTLRATAAGCKAWRSGAYWVIAPNATDRLTQAVVDVSAATVVQSGQTLQMRDDGGCVFRSGAISSGDAALLMVGQSGIGVLHYTFGSGINSGKAQYSLLVPKQNLPLSELQGDWSYVAIHRFTNSPTVSFWGQMNVNSAIQATGFSECQTQSNLCDRLAAGPVLTAHPDGGFLVSWTAEEPERLIAHKAPTGEVSLFEVSTSTHAWAAYTKERALATPSVGTSMATREFNVNLDGFAGVISENDWSVLSNDGPTGSAGGGTASITRGRSTDARVDTFDINSPSLGYRMRANGNCKVNGVSNGCAGVVTLPLPGTGLYIFTGLSRLGSFAGIAVDKR